MRQRCAQVFGRHREKGTAGQERLSGENLQSIVWVPGDLMLGEQLLPVLRKVLLRRLFLELGHSGTRAFIGHQAIARQVQLQVAIKLGRHVGKHQRLARA
eukprot:7663842-Pyramimonas_sp.AAC.1